MYAAGPDLDSKKQVSFEEQVLALGSDRSGSLSTSSKYSAQFNFDFKDEDKEDASLVGARASNPQMFASYQEPLN
jgi:hypothetical protein